MRNLPFVWVRHRTVTLGLLPRLRPFSTDAPGGGSVAVKQVTRSNFNAALEGLRAYVEESDFVAVDLEMTGVTSAPWRDSFEFDRSDVRYLKLKDSAEKFAAVQHNFYIFPRKELSLHGPPDDFLWQATSIDFLAKYQFDFNACIYEGISYLSREQEGEALKGLSSEYLEGLANSFCNFEEPVDIPIVRTSDIFFSERMKNKLHKWHDSILRSLDKTYIDKEDAGINNALFQTVFFKMRPAIMLNGFTSHQLKLIQLIFSTKLVGSLICTREAIYLMKFEDRGQKEGIEGMLLARGWRNKLLKGKKKLVITESR
ncbi:poly(A)-specific ribonuclease PARN-like [Zingiber officinale]|uniref:poly(A)-specific ribonuclease PARN-like n=1 Tax=Zingiber officinale TaxID=94328 RepID=UPI001C4C05F9|nr:poly(A)-specific ribonuclease PARN-like [Zingiber officinale]